MRPGREYKLYAFAHDDFGVKSVAFKAGDADIGTAATAPYESPGTWTPGDDLEGKDVTLTATITDSAGQVTTRTVIVKVQSPAPEPTPTPTATPETLGATPTPTASPTPVVVAAANKLSPPRRLTLAASASSERRVTLSGAVTPSSGGTCPAGAEIRLTLYHAGVLLRRASATLGADCRYRVTLRLTRLAAGHKVVEGTFPDAGPAAGAFGAVAYRHRAPLMKRRTLPASTSVCSSAGKWPPCAGASQRSTSKTVSTTERGTWMSSFGKSR